MAGIIWPVDAVGGQPTYSGRLIRQASNSPIFSGATASRPLGARSGVRPGTSTSTVTVTSATQFSVASFAGVADLETAVEAGPYEFAFNTAATGSINAAAGSARRDLVSVTISDPAESDGSSTPGVAITYTAGTAGTGVDPAVPARSFAIARLNVPAAGGGNPTVTWIAPYAVAAGGVMPIDTLANLSTAPGYLGQYAHVASDTTLTNNGTWVFVGTADGAWANAGGWVPYAGASVAASLSATAGTFTMAADARVSRTGSVVTVHIGGTRSTNIDASYVFFTLPVGFRPSSTQFFNCQLTQSGGGGIAQIRIGTDGVVQTGNYVSSTSSSAMRLDCSFNVA